MKIGPEHQKVREAIETVISHLDADWGFCDDADYSLGCPSCEANLLMRRLRSVESYLEDGAGEKGNYAIWHRRVETEWQLIPPPPVDNK